MELESFLVMIDDFRVPDVEGFGWGSYGGKDIDMALVKNLLVEQDIETCYFPSYSPDEETGYKRLLRFSSPEGRKRAYRYIGLPLRSVNSLSGFLTLAR